MSVLGIDIGTSGSKAIVIDEQGNKLGHAQRSYPMSCPAPGCLELDPAVLWESVEQVIREAASATAQDPVSVLSIATMGDSFVPVDARGAPVGNFILASDARSAREADTLSRELGYRRIYDITGMPPHPINTITKVLWLKNHEPEIFSRAAHFLCAEEFAVSRLGLPPTTSHCNACRTMAFDIQKLRWSEEMLAAVGLGEGSFAAAVPSGVVIGAVSDSVASSLGLPRGVKVVSGGMDQACSALGTKAVGQGIAEDSLGTVEALSFTVDRSVLTDELRGGLLEGHYSVNCHVISGKYLIMALVLSAGSTVQWFSRELGAEDASGDPDSGRDGRPSDREPPPSRLLFLPYLAGSGTPSMDPFARGILMGLDLGIRRDDLLRGIHQGIVHEVSVNLDRLEELGVPISEIRCVGGGSNSDYRLQLRADMLGRTVVRMQDSEAAVLGAAVLAGAGASVWGSVHEGMEQVVREQRVFEPQARYRRFYDAQKQLYRKLRDHTSGLFREYAASLDYLNDRD
ncbi:MAG: hypothetical protein JW820_00460 [Spirochaetales bacterium]|nr:hypothetical protein [Spirochaetales bacterium]